MLRLRSRNPYVVTFMLATFAIGVLSWYGWDWYVTPHYSEQDIAQSAETNLILDMVRRPPEQRPADLAGVNLLRSQIRAELEAQIAAEREEIESGLAAGLICLILALGHGMFHFMLLRNQK